MTREVPVTEPPDGPATYEFHIAGGIGPVIRAALPELTARVVPGFTVLTGTFRDHDDLQRLLDALDAHGVPAVDVHLTGSDTQPTKANG